MTLLPFINGKYFAAGFGQPGVTLCGSSGFGRRRQFFVACRVHLRMIPALPEPAVNVRSAETKTTSILRSCTMRLCLCILALGSNAFADMIIVGAPADAINGDPFAGPLPGFVGSRYQQAYANVDFPSRAMTITSISFFNHSPFEGPLPVASFQIFFSVITANIDSLSNTNFDSNDGLDNTLFASVDLRGSPAPLQLVFAGQPFDYNPANGNLLMDIQISNEVNGGGASYDARSGTAIGVFSRYQNFSDGTQGYGLVTQFAFEPIPEPSTIVLLLGGLSGLVLACRPWQARLRGAGNIRQAQSPSQSTASTERVDCLT